MSLKSWFKTNVEVFWSRRPFSEAARGPAAGRNPWWPGTGPWWMGERQAPVAEQPFVPFDLSALQPAPSAERVPVALQAANEAPAPAPATLPPSTFVELGVPDELARQLEATLRVMGATSGGQVVGFRFKRPDGATGPIRIDEAA